MRRSAFPGFWGVKIFFPVKRRLWEDTESEIFSEMEDIFLVWISIAGREELFWRGVWGSLEAEQDIDTLRYEGSRFIVLFWFLIIPLHFLLISACCLVCLGWIVKATCSLRYDLVFLFAVVDFNNALLLL